MTVTRSDVIDRRPAGAFRQECRRGAFAGHTSGRVPGFAQANLIVLPREQAFDFLLFCQRNPKPCPLLDVTEPGDPRPRGVAPDADLRTDLPRYRVYEGGALTAEPTDIRHWWRADSVAFLVGCSFTFESALLRAGLSVRHIDEGKIVPMYRTDRHCRTAGQFAGPLVVSMRPYAPADAIRATQITARFPQVHGGPVHWGDPAALGIADLDKPDYGEPVTIHPGEVPVFWACGVTPQAVIAEAKLPLVLTHSPGHMFVCDLTDDELTVV